MKSKCVRLRVAKFTIKFSVIINYIKDIGAKYLE